MDTLYAESWRSQGSSVIFDPLAIRAIMKRERYVSLWRALAWSDQLPAPPDRRKTILVAGLETVLQTAEPEEAHDFLRQRIYPLLRRLQSDWTACGLVFAFTAPVSAFQEQNLVPGPGEEVVYRYRPDRSVHLSDGLWNGAAADGLRRLARKDAGSGKEETLGYHFSHLS